MFTGEDNFVLFVDDVETSADFYERLIGFERAPISPKGGAIMNYRGKTPLVLMPRDRGELLHGGEIHGWGAQMMFGVDNIFEQYDHLLAAGVRIETAPYNGGLSDIVKFQDPDGYIVILHSLHRDGN